MSISKLIYLLALSLANSAVAIFILNIKNIIFIALLFKSSTTIIYNTRLSSVSAY